MYRMKNLHLPTGQIRCPSPLAQPNVMRTKHTDIRITDEHGNRYEEGTDYAVIPGDINPYQPPGTPFAIKRLANGKIPDGGTVFAAYDYAPLPVQRVVTTSVSVQVNRQPMSGSESW